MKKKYAQQSAPLPKKIKYAQQSEPLSKKEKDAQQSGPPPSKKVKVPMKKDVHKKIFD